MSEDGLDSVDARPVSECVGVSSVGVSSVSSVSSVSDVSDVSERHHTPCGRSASDYH